ncbi:MAG: Rieske (2Fe-2S) protein [candidate division Zixibacteria bacterium]|nr:Rieske (2Fe-2S) protein [candidate division Zixibacteria bacterium]
MPKYLAAAVEDLPPGTRKIVEIAGRSVGLFNIDGKFYALRNRCPHQGGPLCEGRQSGFLEAEAPGVFRYARRGEILRCAWHGWEFDITTGRSWVDPRRVRTRSYRVCVAPGAAVMGKEADTTLQAETYVVSVEKEYVVVEIP